MSAGMYKRVVLKIGGEALSGEGNSGIDLVEVSAIAHKIKAVHDLGVQIGLVVGAGNFFRGESGIQFGMKQVTAHHMGMLATIMNSLALQDALEHLDVPVRVMTGFEGTRRGRTLHPAPGRASPGEGPHGHFGRWHGQSFLLHRYGRRPAQPGKSKPIS